MQSPLSRIFGMRAFFVKGGNHMIQRPKGTTDILPEEGKKWQFIEKTARTILENYRFFEIRTPIFESFKLFSRGVGETTDVVTKEMYDFNDKGDRHIALRPEGTAPIVRAYIENKLFGPEHPTPYKAYYIGPMFRYERPQSGRQRQFHQLGVEVFNGEGAWTDAETLALAYDLLKAFGLKDVKLVINSLGSTEDRKRYREALIDYLRPHEAELSEDSKRRFIDNPLRVLDSKEAKDQEIVKDAPSILDYLSPDSEARFQLVQDLLTKIGIPFEIDATMVRGLDYYQETIFEFMTEDPVFGAETTICGGGNYSGLVSELSDGKVEAPGFGFAIGLERLILLMDAQDVEIPEQLPLNAYFVAIGDQAFEATFELSQKLRQQGFSVDRDLTKRKPGKQYREADKLGAELAITLGDQEIEQNIVRVKRLSDGMEQSFPMNELETNFSEIYQNMMGEK